MARKKELDEAWRVHDEGNTTGRIEVECYKFAPVVLDKDGKPVKDGDGNPLHAWNEKIGHSHFNPACKAWVENYAKEHPIPRQILEVVKQDYPKAPCAGCKRLVREDYLYQEAVNGLMVCSRKCEKRVANRTMGDAKETAFEEARKQLVEEVARTGEIPSKPEKGS